MLCSVGFKIKDKPCVRVLARHRPPRPQLLVNLSQPHHIQQALLASLLQEDMFRWGQRASVRLMDFSVLWERHSTMSLAVSSHHLPPLRIIVVEVMTMTKGTLADIKAGRTEFGLLYPGAVETASHLSALCLSPYLNTLLFT